VFLFFLALGAKSATVAKLRGGFVVFFLRGLKLQLSHISLRELDDMNFDISRLITTGVGFLD